MSLWAHGGRRALARRIAWAGGLSAMLHAVVLAVIEPPDPDAMQRVRWPQLDVSFAKLSPTSVSKKPSADAPVLPALVPEMFDTAAAAPRRKRVPKTLAEPSAKAAPPARRQAKAEPPRPPRPPPRPPPRLPQPATIMAGPVSEPPSPDGDDSVRSGAEAQDVASTQSADRRHAVASAFPQKLELEYSIREVEGGTVLGWMVYRFERDGDRYHIRATIDAIGVASFFVKGRYVQRSEGRLTADGLQPERFMVRRGRRERVERATFDWHTLRATLTDAKGSREWSLQAGAQDQLSVVHQISFLMEHGDLPRLMVTDGRRFESARIEVVGRETVQTELGPMETVRLRSDLGRGVNVQLWLARDFGYLPARLRVRDKRGREAEQVLANVKVKW